VSVPWYALVLTSFSDLVLLDPYFTLYVYEKYEVVAVVSVKSIGWWVRHHRDCGFV
jgi:hypothetical protein